MLINFSGSYAVAVSGSDPEVSTNDPLVRVVLIPFEANVILPTSCIYKFTSLIYAKLILIENQSIRVRVRGYLITV